MLKINLSKTVFLCMLFLLAASPLVAVAQTQSTDSIDCNNLQTASLHYANDTVAKHTSQSSYFSYASEVTEVKLPKVELNPKAVSFVHNYLKDNDELLFKIKNRSAPYFKLIEGLLQKNELPLELKYLAVIESKLKSNAVSHAGAVGPWQLMPRTAISLGLKITAKTDERKHYYKSTVAVCKYIKDLYRMYGDWLLVIAAYNAGPGNVDKAIKKSGSRNFWYLQYHLPAETRAHVKRFIGAHYYFEQCGSETTLTKAETIAYKKIVSKFIEKQQRLAEEKIIAEVQD